MYYYFFCTVQLEPLEWVLTPILERWKDKLYGMAVSMSADLLRSMPKHLSEESKPAQSTEIQGKN